LSSEEARQRRGRPVGGAVAEPVGEAVASQDTAILLGLLDAVDANASISQRSLASELGIALGMTNAYVRRCIRRGLVKVRQAPANRYAYYLTPKGFAEKSRLTANFLSRSFEFYRVARKQCDQLLTDAVARGWKRIALYGNGDLTEIAVLCAMGQRITLVGVVTPAPAPAASGQFLHLPVVASLADLGAVDGVLLTALHRPQEAFDVLAGQLAADRILVPALLKLRPAARVRAAAGE
jgi:DNA-binding MarR family transcriptional regulator